MHRVMQSTKSNCFAACLASILEIPIENVPIGAAGDTWDRDAVQLWIGQEHNLQMLEIYFGDSATIYPVHYPVSVIVSGASPRGGCLHAVVGKTAGMDGFDLIHDPHKDGTFIIGEPTHVTFFVTLFPVDVSRNNLE